MELMIIYIVQKNVKKLNNRFISFPVSRKMFQLFLNSIWTGLTDFTIKRHSEIKE